MSSLCSKSLSDWLPFDNKDTLYYTTLLTIKERREERFKLPEHALKLHKDF